MLNNYLITPGRQQGLSLIELMIAMTLGLLVIGAVAGVFLSSSRNFAQDERLSRMQENARYALHVLSEDLSMGGYWGPLMSGDDINTNARDCTSSGTDSDGDGTADPDEQYCQGFYQNSVLTIDADCGSATPPPYWVISITNPVEVEPAVPDGTTAESLFNCIDPTGFADDADAGFRQDSDILVIKRVDGEELASGRDVTADDGELFIRTNGADAMLFEYSTGLDVSESGDNTDWRYRSNIYYIQNYFLEDSDGNRDSIPTLVRSKLKGDAVDPDAGDPEEVAQGIEYFHVLFGIDTDDDATANLFDPNPSLDDLESVTAARIYVLARSLSEDPAYENDRTYRLGDVTIDYSANPDGFYRRVFTTTVTLRNQRNRILTGGGS